ncbi:EAL domain-containing protein [Salmonella enterica]|nr:EAL domain-containing protein [Salmonella enterica]
MKNEFVPYIQPIMDIKNNRIKGGEVLMRWMTPEAGVIPPNKFIPLAETSGLIVPMTRELFSSTSNNFRSHTTLLPTDFHLGFNISQLHLQDGSIIADCQNIINAMLPCRVKLVLELLERDPFEYTDEIKSTFTKLKEMGVDFALDDFGTGYSTHDYLQNFDIDYIKIDKNFIKMIGIDIISQHIVDNIISLANNLNIDVIAEGVETVSQEIYLKERSVKYMQGYLYGHPVPLDEFVKNYLNRPEGIVDELPLV